MIVTAWNNGSPNNKTGSGYGIRISRKDRNKYFDPEWDSVEVELDENKMVDVSISSSFWDDCIELRCSEIGLWMLNKNDAPWPKHNPPKYKLTPTQERCFVLNDA